MEKIKKIYNKIEYLCIALAAIVAAIAIIFTYSAVKVNNKARAEVMQNGPELVDGFFFQSDIFLNGTNYFEIRIEVNENDLFLSYLGSHLGYNTADSFEDFDYYYNEDVSNPGQEWYFAMYYTNGYSDELTNSDYVLINYTYYLTNSENNSFIELTNILADDDWDYIDNLIGGYTIEFDFKNSEGEERAIYVFLGAPDQNLNLAPIMYVNENPPGNNNGSTSGNPIWITLSIVSVILSIIVLATRR